jgi:hypothetical protein
MDSSADSTWSTKDDEFFNADLMKIMGQFMATDGAPLRDAYFRAGS